MNVHIGLPKTATTYLQKHIFKGLAYRDHSTPLDLIQARVLSYEGWAGFPTAQGNFLGQFRRNLQNIQRLFPTARIIVGFREPSQMVLSLYKQHLHEGGTMPFRQYTSELDKDCLRYSQQLDLIRQFFGDNHFVYTLEHIHKDSQQVVRAMGAACGLPLPDPPSVKANVGVKTNLQVSGLRWGNTVFGMLPGVVQKALRRVRLDPRNIFQHMLSGVPSPPFEPDMIIMREISVRHAYDWRVAQAAADRCIYG